jgi:hypothetical protein
LEIIGQQAGHKNSPYVQSAWISNDKDEIASAPIVGEHKDLDQAVSEPVIKRNPVEVAIISYSGNQDI